jgi:acetyltransferase-like isoleucine patch superfamily enzyme
MITDKPRFPIREMLCHGWLPSFLKCALYRVRGYKIGHRVRIGFGSVICANKAEIGNDVRVGFFSFFRGRELRLGDRVRIGSACFLDTPHLEIGDDSKFNENVYVGGLQFPDSRLTVGKNCQIMQMTFINPTKYITIGDDTRIGGDSLLFGHASWLSRFEGYPVDSRPIQIGNSVSIAWRVFVGPGAKIGDGAVVGANSFVNHVIPSKCLATGSPARVVGQAPYFPRKLRVGDRETILRDILAEMVEYLRASELDCRHEGDEIEVTWKRNGWFSRQSSEKIRVVTELLDKPSLPSLNDRTTVFLSLRNIPLDFRRQLVARDILWFDIERKERSACSHDLGEEVAQYLRRHGVRFTRLPGETIN